MRPRFHFLLLALPLIAAAFPSGALAQGGEGTDAEKREADAGKPAPEAVRPLAVEQPLHPHGYSQVASVRSMEEVDVVLLNQGYHQGYRPGMRLQVRRGNRVVAEVVVVKVSRLASAALILDLAPGTAIKPGDLARYKTSAL